jgi:S1-C subfamily serine protease
VTPVDWVALVFVVLAALVGFGRGLIVSALSVVAVLSGAVIGGRLAPHLLPDGAASPYTPLVALAGAVVLAVLLEGAATVLGMRLRAGLRLPALRALDAAGGLLLGAAAGLVLVWVVAAVALHLPGQTELRQGVQRSFVLRELNELAPPAEVLEVLAQVDPLPTIAGPAAPVDPPDPSVLREPVVRAAAESVVRVAGTACGLGVAGSGWVAGPELVVTAAHVVAGQRDTSVQPPGGEPLDARAVAFDVRNDVAVLRVPGLVARALPLAEPRSGEPVAILGYPEGGPLTATPGRLGPTVAVISEDAYGRGPVRRTITSIRGLVRHGNSGGPAVDARGAVETTVFASRRGSRNGLGVPDDAVREALDGAAAAVSTGPCAR